MNTEERLELIRRKAARNNLTEYRGRGICAAGNPEHEGVKVGRGPVALYAGREWGCHSEFGVLINPEHARPDWIGEADERKEKPLGRRQRHEQHYLNKIAEKWEALKRRPAGANPEGKPAPKVPKRDR